MSTNSGLSSTNAGMASDSIGGIPHNTSTVDPQAVQSASASASGEQETRESSGPGVSKTGNNVDRTSGEQARGTMGGGKGIAAAVHGAGEKIRGTLNRGVDQAFHENQGGSKNSGIANAGDNEMVTEKFAASTMNREGARPGTDYESRRAQANADLNRE